MRKVVCMMGMEELLNLYYADNAKKLRGIADRILFRLGFLSSEDYEDFYSLANEVFVDAMRRFDGSQSFDGFLYACLCNKFKTEMTRRNRKKRLADRMTISIDTPICEDEDVTLADTIPDQLDVESEIFAERKAGYSRRMLSYLDRLSRLQKEVLELTVAGCPPDEIRRKLHIDKKQYSDCNAAIHSYRNVSVLL